MKKKTIPFQVTERDIQLGQPRSMDCPIARAIWRAEPAFSRVSVRLRTIEVSLDGKNYVVPLPPKSSTFRSRFDGDESVQPFEDELVIG